MKAFALLLAIAFAGCASNQVNTAKLGHVRGNLTIRVTGSHNQAKPSQGFVGTATGEIPLAALGIPGTGSIPVNLGMQSMAITGTTGIYADQVDGDVVIETIGSGNQLFDSVEAAAKPDKSSNAVMGDLAAQYQVPDDEDEEAEIRAVDESAAESRP